MAGKAGSGGGVGKDILDKSVALAAYARQAKNRDLEADAVEIRMRATLRVDELRQAQKGSVGLNRGLAGSSVSGLEKNPVRDDRPTLASQGIDKNLAHHGHGCRGSLVEPAQTSN
jgi:hypothetical protein